MPSLSAIRPRRQNAPRPAEKSAPAYLQWLRGRRCYVATLGGEGCAGKIEAAHVPGAGDKGMGTKTADRNAIPLCSRHHRQQHDKGWSTFCRTHGFSAALVAAFFWDRWPGRKAWEARNAQ